jgi:hypothetical protein
MAGPKTKIGHATLSLSLLALTVMPLHRLSPPVNGACAAVRGLGPHHTLRSDIALSLAFGLSHAGVGFDLSSDDRVGDEVSAG